MSANGYALILVVFGGGLGAVIRLFMERWQGKLPWGILAANVIGSFMAGITSYESAILMTFFIGMVGALTTFSTFAAQTVDFLRHGRITQGLLNVLLNLVLSSTAFLIGHNLVATTLLK